MKEVLIMFVLSLIFQLKAFRKLQALRKCTKALLLS